MVFDIHLTRAGLQRRTGSLAGLGLNPGMAAYLHPGPAAQRPAPCLFTTPHWKSATDGRDIPVLEIVTARCLTIDEARTAWAALWDTPCDVTRVFVLPTSEVDGAESGSEVWCKAAVLLGRWRLVDGVLEFARFKNLADHCRVYADRGGPGVVYTSPSIGAPPVNTALWDAQAWDSWRSEQERVTRLKEEVEAAGWKLVTV